MSQFDNMQAHGLDGSVSAGEGANMTRTPLLITLAAAAALAGCNNSDHTIGGGPDADNGANAAANAPVALPPTIAASKIYRCADNKLVYVDWLSDNKTANIRTEQGGSPTQVAAIEPGKPMTGAAGYELSGSATAAAVKITVPGHASQSCKA
jgi:hypothetical protein